MTSYEIVAIVFSSISLLVSLFTFYKNVSFIKIKIIEKTFPNNSCQEIKCVISNTSSVAYGINEIKVSFNNKLYPIFVVHSEDLHCPVEKAENIYLYPYQSIKITFQSFIKNFSESCPLYLFVYNKGRTKKIKINDSSKK